MTGWMNLSILTLTLAGLAGASVRERRFLLDITTAAINAGPPSSVPGAFSWDFGRGKFSVEDSDAVLEAISEADDVVRNLAQEGLWLFSASFHFRNYLVLESNDVNVGKWTVAAGALTQLYDAVRSAGKVCLDYDTELEDAVNSDDADLAGVMEGALKNCGIAYTRIQRLLPEVTQALSDMGQVDPDNEDYVNNILLRLKELRAVNEDMRQSYKDIIVAAGIETKD